MQQRRQIFGATPPASSPPAPASGGNAGTIAVIGGLALAGGLLAAMAGSKKPSTFGNPMRRPGPAKSGCGCGR